MKRTEAGDMVKATPMTSRLGQWADILAGTATAPPGRRLVQPVRRGDCGLGLQPLPRRPLEETSSRAEATSAATRTHVRQHLSRVRPTFPRIFFGPSPPRVAASRRSGASVTRCDDNEEDRRLLDLKPHLLGQVAQERNLCSGKCRVAITNPPSESPVGGTDFPQDQGNFHRRRLRAQTRTWARQCRQQTPRPRPEAAKCCPVEEGAGRRLPRESGSRHRRYGSVESSKEVIEVIRPRRNPEDEGRAQYWKGPGYTD